MKPHKIKRYSKKRGFSPQPRRSPWKLLGAAALLVALVFVGISVYKPVSDFLGGRTKPTPPDPTPEIASTPDPTPEPPPEPEPEPIVKEPTVPAILDQPIQGIFLPLETAQDPQQLASFMEQIPAGTTAVVFEVKNRYGKITYQTTNELALAWEAMIPNPIDLTALLQLFEDHGLAFIAKMAVYSDPIAARGNLANAVLHSSGVIWIDNTLAAGGKPWSSPYAPQVKEYNIALAKEVSATGAAMLQLDYVRFPYDPTGSARFGGDGSQTAAAAIQSLVTEMQQAVEVPVAVTIPFGATGADAASNNAFYGGDPLTITAQVIVLDMTGEVFETEGILHPMVTDVLGRLTETNAVFILQAEQLGETGALGKSYLLFP